jgi:formate hydrogenlyase transcriptional activator
MMRRNRTGLAASRGEKVDDGNPELMSRGGTEGEPDCRGRVLGLIENIAEHRSLADLLAELARQLDGVVGTDSVVVDLHDPATDRMKFHTIGGRLGPDERVREGLEALPLDDTPAGRVWKTQELLVIDSSVETRFPRFREYVQHRGPFTVVVAPLTTPRRRLGAILFMFRETSPGTSSRDLELFQLVAKHVALAVENALHLEEAEAFREKLAEERDRLRTLLEVNNAIVSELELRKLVVAIGEALRRTVPHEWTGLLLHEPESDGFRLHTLVQPADRQLATEGALSPMGTPWGRAFTTRKPFVGNTTAEIHAAQTSEARKKVLADLGIQSFCAMPLVSRGRALGALCFAASREAAFDAVVVELLAQVTAQVAPAIDNALAYRALDEIKEKLAQEKVYLEDEIRSEGNFEEIVGHSPPLKRVLKDIETVAETDSTVLVMGETGTGKELIARAIHKLSPRRERTFVKLNCAAIPTGLLESELFGHEKGAFTGAVTQKAGRFELAHKGTLFLDEIGEISQELQPKLLRVLQDQEFERLGGTKTIKVDVRLVAATNRDLAKMVAAREFRSDLFYRLNVFPVTSPALRDRGGDVPLLVRHFVDHFARRMGRKVETIPSESMEALERYPWPGNVRELENLIERSVILTKGSVLQVPLAELRHAVASAPPVAALAPSTPTAVAPAPPSNGLSTIEVAEREVVLKALEECGWRVGGEKGAAAKLGISRTTLQSKMQRLGISRPG